MEDLRNRTFFVCGIGTGVGKTVVSAMLVSGLKADYWKPIQCGTEDGSDAKFVTSTVSNFSPKIHPESYVLKAPMSPHAAAKAENVAINPETIVLPTTENSLIIEGVGGFHVPINDAVLMSDLVSRWSVPVILVSQNYLGSINHTLLTIEAIKARKITIRGVIFNGESNPSTESVILNYSGLALLGHVPIAPKVDAQFIRIHGDNLAEKLQ